MLVYSPFVTNVSLFTKASLSLKFAFLKVDGIVQKKSKWIGSYLRFRMIFLLIHLIILGFITIYEPIIFLIIGPVVLHFLIIDMGLTVILTSIMADKEKGKNVNQMINLHNLHFILQHYFRPQLHHRQCNA